MTEAQLSLLADARLSGVARTLGLYLSEATAEGPAEIPRDVFQRLMDQSWRVLARNLGRLETLGWITRKHDTGKGHATEYLFLTTPKTTPQADFRYALLDTLNFGTASDNTPKPFGGVSDNTPSAPSSRSSSKGVGVEGSAGAREVEDRVADLLTSDELKGCRGALRDYLLARVPTDRQWAYVQVVRSWLDGLDPSVFQTSNGGRLARDKMPGVIAVALNDLAASDESMMKRPAGDPANLKTKITIVVRPRTPQTKNGSGGFDPEAFSKGLDDLARERGIIE